MAAAASASAPLLPVFPSAPVLADSTVDQLTLNEIGSSGTPAGSAALLRSGTLGALPPWTYD